MTNQKFKVTFTTEVNAIDEVEAEEKAFNRISEGHYNCEVERR